MARPIEYNEEFVIEKAMEYIASCEDEWVQVVSAETKDATMFKERLKVKMPTMEGLALYLGIHRDTLYDWAKKYPQFSDVLEHLRAKQADRLINNGLSGDYNPTIAKVLLTKHGYTDKQEIDHTTQGEKIQSVNYTGISDAALREIAGLDKPKGGAD